MSSSVVHVAMRGGVQLWRGGLPSSLSDRKLGNQHVTHNTLILFAIAIPAVNMSSGVRSTRNFSMQLDVCTAQSCCVGEMVILLGRQTRMLVLAMNAVIAVAVSLVDGRTP